MTSNSNNNHRDYHLSPTALRSSPRMSRPRTPNQPIDRPFAGHGTERTSPSLNATLMRTSTAQNTSPTAPQRQARQEPPRLPALPRFHPANYASSPSTSASSSTVVSPDVVVNAPNGPLSPRTYNQVRQYSEAQRQLYLYHRELVNLNRSSATSSGMTSPAWRSSRPVSPQLKPMGSPGPITPFDLEVEADQGEDYLMAGAGAAHARASGTPLSEAAQDELLESYIRKETHHQQSVV